MLKFRENLLQNLTAASGQGDGVLNGSVCGATRANFDFATGSSARRQRPVWQITTIFAVMTPTSWTGRYALNWSSVIEPARCRIAIGGT